MSLWARVVQANRPGPPEHSVSFRVASAAAVVVGTAACWHQGELSAAMALFAVAATVTGNVLSYRTRFRPWPAVKPLLAAAAVAGFTWFLITATHSADPGDIATVEQPLATLFAWILSTHAFDVPARRDVAYSLAGSAALMAVAGAQAVDIGFAVYVVAWAGCGLWGLVAMWRSAAGVTGTSWRPAVGAAALVVVLAAVGVALAPPPRVSSSLVFPSSSAGAPVNAPGGLTDGSPSLPAHAASARGRTAVGGYLGFARSLDTADRVALGNQVVLRVRATRPGYWVGETYDTWNGRSWSSSPQDGATLRLATGSPFTLPGPIGELQPVANDAPDIETFYLAQSGPNLVFHTELAQRVYVQTPTLTVTGNGSIVAGTSMGAGTVYTVVAADTRAAPDQLQTAGSPAAGPGATSAGLTPGEAGRDLQLPHPYPRVAALARSITGLGGSRAGTGAPPTTYAAVTAIEAWMTSHVRYTTAIPPLAPGQDGVTHFLFGSRRGYCEQISTATVVMLRSLGIPAREAVGYVPGSFNPITDLYEVRANDAHAWVQVWYPGYGWQDVDPTAQVPLANPSPGSVLAADLGRALSRVPLPVGAVLGAVLAAAVTAGLVRRRRRRRPPSWAHRVAADLERGGRRRGVVRGSDQTLASYGASLAERRPDLAAELGTAVTVVERSVYGGIEPSADELARVLGFSREFARRPRSRRSGGGDPPVGDRPPAQPGQPGQPGQLRAWASASSNDTPAATSGR